MKKKTLINSSAVILTLITIFAFTTKSVDKPVAKLATKLDQSECCNSTSGNCEKQYRYQDVKKECCEKK